MSLISDAILLKKTLMKNQSGLYLSLLTKKHGFIDIKGYSARRPGKSYLGLDYFRVFTLELATKGETYKMDSILSLGPDFSKDFLLNRLAYKFIMYLQDVSFKVLAPLNPHFTDEQKIKFFDDFMFLYKSLTKVDEDKFIKIIYRYLLNIYSVAGFIEKTEIFASTRQEILDQIRFFNEEFLESSIKIPEFSIQ